MAMSKADMELHSSRYSELVELARIEERAGNFTEAIRLAMSAWEFVSGMVRYEIKENEQAPPAIDALDIVLTNAPPRLNMTSLDALQAFLAENRRFDKSGQYGLEQKLSHARALTIAAHRAWNQLHERGTVSKQQLDNCFVENTNDCTHIVTLWTEMRLVHQVGGGIAPVTRLNVSVTAKCSGCGVRVKTRKCRCFSPMECPGCRSTMNFVILTEHEQRESGG